MTTLIGQADLTSPRTRPRRTGCSSGCAAAAVDDGCEPWRYCALAAGRTPRSRARTPTPEQQRWTQDRVARELEAWFAQRCFEQWPPYSAFLRDHRRPLYVAVLRCGGPQRWAQELGVAFIARRPGPQCSQAELRERLRALFCEHRLKRFPSQRWLREHGPRGLAEQIRRSGGARRWARELGVPGPQPAKWTDELIEAELGVVRPQEHVADQSRILDAGLGGLLTAVSRGHGSAWWARRLGLPQRRRPRHGPAHNSDLGRNTTLADTAQSDIDETTASRRLTPGATLGARGVTVRCCRTSRWVVR